jgi:hypothetical protein
MKSNKYNIRVVQDNTTWTAEITRRVTSKKILISKSQNGFKTESEAKDWGKKELSVFLNKQNERNKRHSS